MAPHKLLARQFTGAFEDALRFDEGHHEEGVCHRLGIRSHVKGTCAGGGVVNYKSNQTTSQRQANQLEAYWMLIFRRTQLWPATKHI